MSYLKMELLLDLADGNKVRLKESASGLAELSVKIGSNPIQSVVLSEAEADLVKITFSALLHAKKQVPAAS